MERKLTVDHAHGIHVRPSVAIAEISASFVSEVRLEVAEHSADARNVMEILALEVTHSTVVTVIAEGEDAEQVLDALQELFAQNFGL